MLGVEGYDLLPEEGVAKIKAHDVHPREHRDGGEVSEVSNSLAEVVWLVEDNKEESC